MRAVVVREFGSPQGLELVEVPDPEPVAGQVIIANEAAGVGGVDAVIRRGAIRRPDLPEGFVLGSEVAGTVTAVGDGVDRSWLGRRVWGFTGLSGGYAERAVVGVEHLTELPADLTPVQAVALGGAGPVAHFALEHARLRSGETVLVRGAAGSIGLATVELARRGGAAVAVTTSSAARGERLREFGATHVLDRAGTGDGPELFDVVIDVAGGPDVPRFIDRLAPNGRLVLVGAVAGWPSPEIGTALLNSFQMSRSLATFSLDTIAPPARDTVRAGQFQALLRGELHAVVHDVLPLGQAVEAHRRMDDGEVFGRIVLTS